MKVRKGTLLVLWTSRKHSSPNSSRWQRWPLEIAIGLDWIVRIENASTNVGDADKTSTLHYPLSWFLQQNCCLDNEFEADIVLS
jgi:hypothetical protein